MSVQQLIESKINEQLEITHLEVINESHLHAGHAHGGVETHYKVIVVSTDFTGKFKVARQKMIYKILADMINNPIHALAMQTCTPEEWLKL